MIDIRRYNANPAWKFPENECTTKYKPGIFVSKNKRMVLIDSGGKVRMFSAAPCVVKYNNNVERYAWITDSGEILPNDYRPATEFRGDRVIGFV